MGCCDTLSRFDWDGGSNIWEPQIICARTGLTPLFCPRRGQRTTCRTSRLAKSEEWTNQYYGKPICKPKNPGTIWGMICSHPCCDNIGDDYLVYHLHRVSPRFWRCAIWRCPVCDQLARKMAMRKSAPIFRTRQQLVGPWTIITTWWPCDHHVIIMW